MLNAREVVELLQERDIEPDETFTAAAGQDYGFVACWHLANHETSLVRYGNSGETNYAYSEIGEDLAGWLLKEQDPYEELDPYDQLIQEAQIRGPDAIAEATEADTGPFCILIINHYNGGTIDADLLEEHGTIVEFATLPEAREWITEEDDGPYCLSHNEASRATYIIVKD